MYKNQKRSGKKAEDYELLTKYVSEVSQLSEKSKDEYYPQLGKQLKILSKVQNLTGLF